MKIYNTQEQINADIINGVLTIDGWVQFKCHCKINASLKISGDVDAWDLDIQNIEAQNIRSLNFAAWDIKAQNIDALGNIAARNIEAADINFFRVAFATETFRCKSIKGLMKKNKYFCLGSDVVITGDKK